jgi:class 3 adenylate cyclase
MLFCLPLFDIHTYPEWIGAAASLSEGGLKMIHNLLVVDGASSAGFYDAVNDYEDGTDGLYALVLNGTSYADHANVSFTLSGLSHRALRCEEFIYTTYEREDDVGDAMSFAFFDVRYYSVLTAALNLCRTTFVCVVLALGALLFSKDANTLVLKPIERMVKKVREVSENPLRRFEVNDGGDAAGATQMETRLLENSIAKICGLLAVGFGEAGSAVIAENMKRGGEIDPMIPGKKVCAIFGFCDIRQFTDTTEVLQEGIMEFVNTIGKIVHMEVHLHGGSANKNIGDAFLLVWKFPKDITLHDVEAPHLTTKEKREQIAVVANNALASFVVIMAGLRRSAKLNTYRNDTRLNARLPNFEVKMGFGLHVGWAIEGAIGSEYKVDASYLSPNVNMSARLEAATKQFGVPLLLSEDFVHICGERVRAQCRQLDVVTVKGSAFPMGIYTYDVNLDEVPQPGDDSTRDPTAASVELESNSFQSYEDEFEEHPDIVALRRGVTETFLSEFKRGFDLYRAGEWGDAAAVLRETARGFGGGERGDDREDGPSLSLLRVMEAHGCEAPRDWKGYRELTEK